MYKIKTKPAGLSERERVEQRRRVGTSAGGSEVLLFQSKILNQNMRMLRWDSLDHRLNKR